MNRTQRTIRFSRFATLLLALATFVSNLANPRIVGAQQAGTGQAGTGQAGTGQAGAGQAGAGQAGAGQPNPQPAKTTGSGKGFFSEDKAPGEEEDKRPLYEQDPYDLITLDQSNNNEVLKVVQLERPIPKPTSAESTLKARLFTRPGAEFQIAWKAIARIDTFEQMLLVQGDRLVAEGKLDEAYRFYEAVAGRYPKTPLINESIQNFLYLDAGRLFSENRHAEALAVLEELRSRNPNYNRPGAKRSLSQLISATAERVISAYVEKADYRAARAMIERLEKSYSAGELEAVTKLKDRMIAMATEHRTNAETNLAAGKFKLAQKAAQAMIDVWPQLPGGKDVVAKIFREYPVVRVAVVQPMTEVDVTRIDNRASRRVSKLLTRTLLEFDGPGAEGGQYVFPWGNVERSDDRTQVIFRVDAKYAKTNSPVRSGYDVASLVRSVADMSNPNSVPDWASIYKSVKVNNVLQVQVGLRRPHVMPESLLQVPLEPISLESPSGTAILTGSAAPPGALPPSFTAYYSVGERLENKIEFQARDRISFRGPAEVVETYIDSSRTALSKLRAGDIDVIDCLFPADAATILEQTTPNRSIELRRYSVPTIHLLAPNYSRPFPGNRTFRRGIIYAINRGQILGSELLGGKKLAGCRLISGPFPAAVDEKDAMAYAYDESLSPLPYDPSLGKLYSLMSLRELAEKAKTRKENPPELKELILAHPAHETPRVACQAIVSQLGRIGINVTLRELPPGQTRVPDNAWDFLYIEAAIAEPLVEVKRLLGESGAASVPGPYVRLALRNLELSKSWRDVSEQMHLLHRAVVDDSSVIPLWQTVDWYAYRTNVKGIQDRSVSLYQHIGDWQVELSE